MIHKSLTSFFSVFLFFISLFVVLGSILNLFIWSENFREYNDNQVVADVTVSKLIISDGKPSFTLKIKENSDIASWNLKSSNVIFKSPEAIEMNLNGDTVSINADYIKWNGYLKFINFKPVYKISKVITSYSNESIQKQFGSDEVEINGGPDWFVSKLKEKPDKLKLIATGMDISSGQIKVQNIDKEYIIVLKNGVTNLQER